MAVSEVIEGERILELPLAARDATVADHAVGRRGGRRRGRHRRHDDDRHGDLGGRRPAHGRAVHARRRDAQQPLVRRQHADAVSGRAGRVPRQHQRPGSADRAVVRRDGEPGDPLGNERLSRHAVLVRPQRRAQRPAGDRARTRSAEAEPAGRHARRPAACATGCSSSAATRAPSNGRRRRPRCRSCRRRRCSPATGPRSTSATSPTGAMRIWPPAGSIPRATARWRCTIAARLPQARERLRRGALGRAQRTARQADRHAASTTSTRRTCRSSAATSARSTGRRSPTTSRTC